MHIPTQRNAIEDYIENLRQRFQDFDGVVFAHGCCLKKFPLRVVWLCHIEVYISSTEYITFEKKL